MASRTREKLALLVFALLILLGLAGVAWYLVVGHSWNVAASNIDDSVGQMEGYTAIVYAGTTLPEKTASSTSKGTTASIQQSVKSLTASSASSSPSLSGDASASDTPEVNKDAATGSTSDVGSVAAPVVERTSEAADASNAATLSDAETPASPSSSDSSTASTSEPSSEDARVALSPARDEAQLTDASTDSSSRSYAEKDKTTFIDPDDVSASYQDKKSSVLTLDTLDGGAYSEGCIVKRGSKRIGVISIEVPVSATAAQAILRPFTDAKVDMVVCITPVKRYVEAATGIDIVITTHDDTVSTIGETTGKTFYVAAPEQGKVGAILISPSSTVSAKVIDAL